MPRPIKVTFDPKDCSFDFNPEELRVPPGKHEIVFQLKTKGRGWRKAHFDEKQAVQFKKPQEVFTTYRRGRFQWILLDDNQDECEACYAYQVTVVYEGERITSPDPFIINDPPDRV